MRNTNQNQTVAALLTLLVLLSSTVNSAEVPLERASKTFYADARHGDDTNSGTLPAPFKTLSKALAIVDARVKAGIRSDKIYLRAGVYRNDAVPVDTTADTFTCYHVNLQGTAENPSVVSAMPAEPNAPRAIQAPSGKWYEEVVIDDGYVLPKGIWKKYDEYIWQAKPGYLNIHFDRAPHQAMSLKTPGFRWGGNSDNLAIGARIVLQDGEALLWKDPWPEYNPLTDPYDPNPKVDPAAVLTEPGMRTYDQVTGTLYLWPYDNKDPNTAKMESWKGRTPDCRFRHLLHGDMVHTEIKGLQFRLIMHVFRDMWFNQKFIEADPKADYQHLKFEDNIFSYCWTQLFEAPHRHEVIKDVPRTDWQIRHNIFFRPSRECFQTWGDNHVFEYNWIIGHGGPWAGATAVVGALNLRHTRNARVRYNYIQHLGNRWYPGTAIMFETDIEQRDADGNCRYTRGAIIEHNIFCDMNGGTAVHLGRGGGRMRDITIRNNIFAVNRGTARYSGSKAIVVTSPHMNLKIHNNVFYQFKDAVTVYDDRSKMNLEDMPGTISIRDNIFAEISRKTIDPRLLKLPGVTIDRNLFFEAGNSGGDNVIEANPLFTDPARFNFTLQPDSPAIREGNDLGVYEFGKPVPAQSQWWNAKSHGSVSRLNKEPGNPRRKEIP